jgi:NADH dehydrogenase FAD-containing subunit
LKKKGRIGTKTVEYDTLVLAVGGASAAPGLLLLLILLLLLLCKLDNCVEFRTHIAVDNIG